MLSQRAFGMGRRGNHRVWLASAVCGRSVAESGVVQCPPRTYLRLTPPGFGSPIVRSYPGTAPMDRVFSSTFLLGDTFTAGVFSSSSPSPSPAAGSALPTLHSTATMRHAQFSRTLRDTGHNTTPACFA
ncbi:hypothetical protein OH76DRAFT_883078 [Lentinus brumalis]|uniref:Uncharacterized protein n=1 Tax=Lentinus brumalis TaxID=2498619 RepID=A0A371DS13_9APHY|nr:hypothetical protein OH76DRAFT_883078 [Polyporus brumalis]